MLLVPTLLLTLDPLRLGLILLLITRARPVQSLFAYWVGAMTASVPYMLVPLMVLHAIPSFRSFADRYANPATLNNPTVGHIQMGIGALALSIAAVMGVRFRAHQRASLAIAGAPASTLPPDGDQDVTKKSAAPKGRLRARIHTAWENGSTWPAFMFGAMSGPPPVTALLVLTTVMASGAAIGTQISLALAWVVGMFAVVEIILISHLVAPVRTQAALQLLHDWILAHKRQVLIAMIVVAGVAMLALGMRGIGAGP
ncbi:hypothetical protein MPRM_17790 [Mycobacterium parmense]|uniref:Uncharacterized protein n=1 Tax=Mycobacterium parmense TaxID=185642 RepID=A0A7I7YRK0_9MYCO|nr:hypothetical protein AWC20_01725 [Mycobacterium parmense]BBZ44498.1 hypothetical protein MPRM_17790 [Mycobacterium parmense]